MCQRVHVQLLVLLGLVLQQEVQSMDNAYVHTRQACGMHKDVGCTAAAELPVLAEQHPDAVLLCVPVFAVVWLGVLQRHMVSSTGMGKVKGMHGMGRQRAVRPAAYRDTWRRDWCKSKCNRREINKD